jgi:hypothetical protein
MNNISFLLHLKTIEDRVIKVTVFTVWKYTILSLLKFLDGTKFASDTIQCMWEIFLHIWYFGKILKARIFPLWDVSDYKIFCHINKYGTEKRSFMVYHGHQVIYLGEERNLTGDRILLRNPCTRYVRLVWK